MPKRSATARWDGTLQEGKGVMKMATGAYEGQYSFTSRFEEGVGTNPEELIAAAHAGCFSMALSGALGRAGHHPESISTTADVRLDRSDAGFSITAIALRTEGRVSGISEAEFQKAAEGAKEGCPVSRALSPGIEVTVAAKLVS